ncbi:hypothetical protein SPONL_259 [uncultured Candidatus Thioglobus sp.]|nr:hypothetical protein SPONL_259 [uncultured Candidatus Thioglobus sp.]
MMREIRDKVDLEIKDLSWQEESEYLKQRNKSFSYLTTKIPTQIIPTDR